MDVSTAKYAKRKFEDAAVVLAKDTLERIKDGQTPEAAVERARRLLRRLIGARG